MSLFPFMKNFLGVKGGQAADGVVRALVQLDPDAATQADLRTMDADLDRAGQTISKLRADLAQEQKEYDAINRQYGELMSAAELLKKQVDDPQTPADRKADLSKSLDGLVARLEQMAPELDRDKQMVTETQSLIAEAEQAYKDKAQALANAKQNLDRARHELQHASIEEQRAHERAQQAEVVAGLKRSSTSTLTVALDAMQRSADEAHQRAAASTLKAETLTEVKTAAVDPNVAAALAQVHGTSSPQSVSDRLAALKR
jgi:chromosome segregation ATPase